MENEDQRVESSEDLELLASLCDGVLSPGDLDDETLERALESGGTELLASMLADRLGAATKSPESTVLSISEEDGMASNELLGDKDSGEISPIARIGPRWGRRISIAAGLALAAGVSFQMFSSGNGSGLGTSPMDWSQHLNGMSGIIDGTDMKGARGLFEIFVQSSEVEVTHPVVPQVLDLDDDGMTDAVVFGFIIFDDAGVAKPWSVAVFAGNDDISLSEVDVKRWGLPQLAAAGFTKAFASRANGEHMAVSLFPSGDPENISIDENGDGVCDIQWEYSNGLGQQVECSGTLRGATGSRDEKEQRLDRSYRTIIQDGRIPGM